MPEKVTIRDIREVPAREPERVGKIDMMVTYSFDAFRTYMTLIPKEEFTEEKLIEVIRAEEEERKKWIGKTITV